jgi:hypothetical protein
MVPAGRTLPKASLSAGAISSCTLGSVMVYCTRTTSASAKPALSSVSAMVAKAFRA